MDNAIDENNHTFTTLGYANGPGYTANHDTNLTNSIVGEYKITALSEKKEFILTVHLNFVLKHMAGA